jgi:hypothetical protein
MSETYVVMDRIWHTGDNRHYERGEVVTLDHLDNISVEVVVETGAVTPWQEGDPWPIPPEEDEEVEPEPEPEPEPLVIEGNCFLEEVQLDDGEESEQEEVE